MNSSFDLWGDTTTVGFMNLDEAQAYLDNLTALLWLYDNSWNTDLELLLEVILSIFADKLISDAVQEFIGFFGIEGLSAAAIEAIGQLASGGLPHLEDLLGQIGEDEARALRQFIYDLEEAISLWSESGSASSGTFLEITTYATSWGPDYYTITLKDRTPIEYSFSNYDGWSITIEYQASLVVNLGNPIQGAFTGFGELMESFAILYAPNYWIQK